MLIHVDYNHANVIEKINWPSVSLEKFHPPPAKTNLRPGLLYYTLTTFQRPPKAHSNLGFELILVEGWIIPRSSKMMTNSNWTGISLEMIGSWSKTWILIHFNNSSNFFGIVKRIFIGLIYVFEIDTMLTSTILTKVNK